jgi:hypothetical protein
MEKEVLQIEPHNPRRLSDLAKIRNVVAQIFASWNPLTGWMRQIDGLHRAA